VTSDQETRLLAAIRNFEELCQALYGEDVANEFIEQTIKVWCGQADALLEEDNKMGRPKKVTPVVESGFAVPAPLPTLTNEEKDALILAWTTAKKEFDEAKAAEHACRQALVIAFFDTTKLEGSDTVDIGYGYGLKIKRELAYNATNEERETESLLNAIGPIDYTLATELIRWKPDVAVKVYRKVAILAEAHPTIKAAMTRAITIKPGMPQLEMVPPKIEGSGTNNVIIYGDQPTTVAIPMDAPEPPVFQVGSDWTPPE
jgi:hypothetical protein